MKQLISTLVFASLSQTSMAGVFVLKFPRVSSALDRASCQAFVDATAGELAQQSGAQVIDYGCQEDEFTVKGMDAVITYQSPARLVVTSTYTSAIFGAAFYASRENCMSQLAGQRQSFTDATGLTPLASYCMLDVNFNRQWQTRVDGIGQAKLNPETTALSFWGTIVDEQATLSHYRTAAGDYDMTVFEAGVSRESFGKKIVIRFYASEPYSFEDYKAMQYGSVESCSAAASAVVGVLKSATKPVVAFCEQSSNGSGVATLHATSFVKSFEPVSVFKGNALTTVYSNQSACQQAADNIEGSASDVFGAVCAGSEGHYRIHVFSQP